MNKREPQYWTCNKNKVQIMKTIYVNDAKMIERSVIKKMEQYRIQNNKEYFECSYNEMIGEIASCVMFFEQTEIDLRPDDEIEEKSNVGRLKYDFDKNKKIKTMMLDNNCCFDCMVGINPKQYAPELNQQIGGDADYMRTKYINYKIKYLTLKYESLGDYPQDLNIE